MGRPPRRFPRANGIFCTPHSDHRTTANTIDGRDGRAAPAPADLQRDMTHGALGRYLKSVPALMELASVLIVGVDSNSLINLHAGCEKPDSADVISASLRIPLMSSTVPLIADCIICNPSRVSSITLECNELSMKCRFIYKYGFIL